MGNGKQFTKLQRSLEKILTQCDQEHIYRGTIFEFETVGTVPRERLVKGMLIDRKEGMRHVSFQEAFSNNTQIRSSILNVGDSVIVIGRLSSLRENTTFSHLIILPEKQILLISQRTYDPREHEPGESALAILYCIIAVLSVPLYFMSPFLFPILRPFWGPFTLLYITLFLLFFGIVGYQKFVRRARVIHFDTASWTTIVNIIRNHLPVGQSTIFD